MDSHAAVYTFGPFRLVVDQRELWKDDVLLQVRALPLALLTYLVQHPEQVLSGEDLRHAVWGGTRVGREALRGCVRELRQVLGDAAATPRYVQTVGRQGYCFIGFRLSPPLLTPPSEARAPVPVSPTPAPLARRSSLPAPFVGRERELSELHRGWAQAQDGRRQVILVSGEPGIGKTTLIEQFVQTLTSPSAPAALWVGHGQCVEAYGAGEAYLPLLEALGRLGREAGRGALSAVLHRHAPTWLTQLPTLVEPAVRAELHRQGAGATPERMLRELCDALEVLTAEHPLLLVLEDLQWSDTGTLAWLAAVARRPDPARLMVLGAYRPLEVLLRRHPLRGVVQELRTHRLCREVRLELWSAAEVDHYVHHRVARRRVAAELGRRLYERTEGHPLFVVASLEALLAQGGLGPRGVGGGRTGELAALAEQVPEDLQHFLTHQLESVAAEDRQLLEVASVSGLTFTTAEVAAGCHEALASSESRCAQLARRGQFLVEAGVAEWPDGTLTLRYRFRHALYQQVVLAQLGRGQQVRLHRLIGERKEAGYGEQGGEIAGELARHFTQGRDYRRAVHYRQLAAEQAWQRSGLREAMTHCEQGLTLLGHLPDTPERARQELALRRLLASAQLAVLGVAAEALGQNLERARRVGQEVEEREALLPVLVDLSRFYLWRAESVAAAALAEQERALLARVEEPALALQLLIPLGSFDLMRGAPQPALAQYERAVSLFDPHQHATLWHALSVDPLTLALLHGSLSAWLAGRPEQARSWLHRGLARAEEVGHPPTLGYAVSVGALVWRCLGEPQEAWHLAQRSVGVGREHGFALYTRMGEVLQSWGKGQPSELEAGLPALAQALAAYRATGARLFVPFCLAALAEGYLAVGRIAQGVAVVTEALELTETTLDRFWHAELYRLHGELVRRSSEPAKKRRGDKASLALLRRGPSVFSSAEACFAQALAVARQQGAHALELRAGMSLSRLWQHQGKRAEARQLLAEIYGWFTEGFDTKDLQEAKALLAELS